MSRVWTSNRFVGVRVGHRYFKLRDTRVNRLLFSERNGYGYRRLARVGAWELGVRTSISEPLDLASASASVEGGPEGNEGRTSGSVPPTGPESVTPQDQAAGDAGD